MLYFSLAIFALISGVRGEISCKNNAGEDVDWFIIYKTPQMSSNIGHGIKYFYMDSDLSDEPMKWVPGDGHITQNDNALYHTLQSVFSSKNPGQKEHYMYSDEPPVIGGADDKFGAAKGVVSYDSEGGYWLIHSVPEFPPLSHHRYSYPATALSNAHMHFCISMDKDTIDKVGKQLRYIKPFIYDESASDLTWMQAPNDSLDDKHVEQMSSMFGQQLLHFAKSARFDGDIYDNWVATYLERDFFVQSGKKTPGQLPSKCGKGVKVLNIEKVKLGEVEFPSKKDHSKWAITPTSLYVCIGDVERSKDSLKRGGGVMCFKNYWAWQEFDNVVQATEECKKTKKTKVEL